MTRKVSPPHGEHYFVPARQLSGTRDEVLAQIDELIVGLTGLRQPISLHGPTPTGALPRKLRLVKGFLKVLFVSGIALWASSAQGQTGGSGSTPPAAQDQEGTRTQKAADNPWAGVRLQARCRVPGARRVPPRLVEPALFPWTAGKCRPAAGSDTALVGGVWWFGTKDGAW